MRTISRVLVAGLISILCVATAPQVKDAAGSITPMMYVGCCR